MEQQVVHIDNEMDILRVRKAGISMAAALGFSDIECAEIEIVISELGTNIVKHANANGIVYLTPYVNNGVQGLEIKASDYGGWRENNVASRPTAVENFVQDGFSTSGSLGIGLSGVRRIVDEFDLERKEKGGIEITVKKNIRNNQKTDIGCSAFSRPKFGENYCGDGYFIKQLHKGIFFSIIDTLGHGREAYDVTQKALIVIESNYHKPLTNIIDDCHKQLKGERGAAIALGQIDTQNGIFKHISVGNIETRIYGADCIKQPGYFNGTVGVIYGSIREGEYPYKKGNCIIMHSDGLSAKFDPDRLLLRKKPQEIAHHIFMNYAKGHDDATVLVLK